MDKIEARKKIDRKEEEKKKELNIYVVYPSHICP
jgi:hypothetical protein